MRLTDERPAGTILITAHAPGAIRIGDTVLRASCLLRADRVITDWRPQRVSELTSDDFARVLELEPEIVVLGTGTKQRFPPHALIAQLLTRGVGCEVMDTGAACRTYNVLASEGRRVVAALLLQDDS